MDHACRRLTVCLTSGETSAHHRSGTEEGQRLPTPGSTSRWESEAELPCHPDQVCERLGLHLLHDLASMSLNRDLASSQFGTHLLVQPAGHDQLHDLPLASSKRRIAFPERLELGRPSEGYSAVLDCASDRLEQHVDIERLGEEFD